MANFEGFLWVGNVTANGKNPDVIIYDINWLVLRISEPSTSSALFGLVTDMTNMTNINLSTTSLTFKVAQAMVAMVVQGEPNEVEMEW